VTVVYIDLLILLNLTANYLLLLGAGRIAGCPLRRWKIGLGAGLGALYAAAAFLPNAGWVTAWPCKVGAGVLMALISYGGGPGLLRVTVLFFAASAALAGLVLGVEWLGHTGLTVQNGVFYSTADIRLLLVLFILCYFVLSLIFRRMGRHGGRELVRLEITFGQRKVFLTALKDSGHTLTDPVTNRTVVVADCRYAAPLLPEGVFENDSISAMEKCHTLGIGGVRLIPYRAVGVNCGLLFAVKSDEVKANGKKIGGLLIAFSPNPVDDGGGYQALIGGELL